MSKDAVIAQLREVFRRYGYEGASLSKISQATGLGRASLYHYFPKGKEEMAATVLECISAELEEHLLKPLQGKETPITKISAMGKTLSEFYNSGQSSCLIDVLSVGEAQTLFQSSLRHILIALIDAIAQVLIEAGQDRNLAHQRAEDALIQIQGSLVLSRCLGKCEPFQRAIAKLPEVLGLN